MSEWLLFNANSAIFHLYHEENKVYFQWDDDEVCFVLDQHAKSDFYSASSLKQKFADRHVAPLKNIILIPSQPVFAPVYGVYIWSDIPELVVPVRISLIEGCC